jgi:large subunit ribosomal protein L2
MGKNLPTQRRGRGTSPTYRSPSHRHVSDAKIPRISGEGRVLEIRHAPGRSAPLARVALGEKEFFMIAPDGLQVGQIVGVGRPTLERGTIREIGQLPEGTFVCNIELNPGDGGRLVRAAGTSAVVVSQGDRTVVRLPSGSFKEIQPRCRAIVGIVAGAGHKDKPFYKAGKRVNAYRSKAKSAIVVRGVAKNAVDHPHGGGAHQHVGRPSTVSAGAPPGRKVGRLSPKRKRRR